MIGYMVARAARRGHHRYGKWLAPILDHKPRSPSFHRYCKFRKANSENGAIARQAALNQMTDAAEPVVS